MLPWGSPAAHVPRAKREKRFSPSGLSNQFYSPSPSRTGLNFQKFEGTSLPFLFIPSNSFGNGKKEHMQTHKHRHPGEICRTWLEVKMCFISKIDLTSGFLQFFSYLNSLLLYYYSNESVLDLIRFWSEVCKQWLKISK